MSWLSWGAAKVEEDLGRMRELKEYKRRKKLGGRIGIRWNCRCLIRSTRIKVKKNLV